MLELYIKKYIHPKNESVRISQLNNTVHNYIIFEQKLQMILKKENLKSPQQVV